MPYPVTTDAFSVPFTYTTRRTHNKLDSICTSLTTSVPHRPLLFNIPIPYTQFSRNLPAESIPSLRQKYHYGIMFIRHVVQKFRFSFISIFYCWVYSNQGLFHSSKALLVARFFSTRAPTIIHNYLRLIQLLYQRW